MQILMLGQNDPAGMMIAFANAINHHTTHTARVISMRTVYSSDYEYDIELARIKDDYSEIEDLLIKSDIFHFHMLLDENYQLGPIQIKDYIHGKGLLYHHHGTYDHQSFLALAKNYNDKYKSTKKRAIVSTPDLLKLLPIATWQPNLVPLNNIDFLPRFSHLTNQSNIKIAQAPTRKWNKHTAEFSRVCTKLESKYPNVKGHIIENISHRECLKFKRSCHAVFDHMNGWFGISSLESLAQGVPTIAGLDDWNITQINEFTGLSDIPWIIARTENELELELSKLIRDPELRLIIGKASRRFMESSWSEKQVLSLLTDTYNKL